MTATTPFLLPEENAAAPDIPPSAAPAEGRPEPEPLPATNARVGQQTGGKTRSRKMLVSLAGTMTKRGMSLEAIEAALLAENAAKCDPPLPEAKVRSIAADIIKRYPPGEPTAPVAAALPPMTAEDAARITAGLLETCRAWIRRYIVVSEEQAVIMAAWELHTYVFDAAETTPYIHITAPEKECGKSYLMEVLEALAAAPIRSGGMTAAALVRTIHPRKPTIFLDEMDAQLGGNKELAEAVRGILNEGFHNGGKFYKCNATTHEVEEFNAYCPKCFAGIGQLPDTVASRSIRIEMRRKLPGESVEPLRQKAVRKAALPIKAKLEAWEARRAADLLCPIEPAPIAGLGTVIMTLPSPCCALRSLQGMDGSEGSPWHCRRFSRLPEPKTPPSALPCYPTSAPSSISVERSIFPQRNWLRCSARSKAARGLSGPTGRD